MPAPPAGAAHRSSAPAPHRRGSTRPDRSEYFSRQRAAEQWHARSTPRPAHASPNRAGPAGAWPWADDRTHQAAATARGCDQGGPQREASSASASPSLQLISNSTSPTPLYLMQSYALRCGAVLIIAACPIPQLSKKTDQLPMNGDERGLRQTVPDLSNRSALKSKKGIDRQSSDARIGTEV